MAPWERSLLGSFVGELVPYIAAAAGVGLLVGVVVVLASNEARNNPALVIVGSMLAGAAFMFICGLLLLALALTGD